METSTLFVALVSLASASVFEMNEYREKMNIRRPRWRDITDPMFEDNLMYLCCNTDNPSAGNKEDESAAEIKKECCDEMLSKMYGSVQRMMMPPRRHRQYLNETACFMLCGFRKLEAADSEGNVKDDKVETVAASLGITSSTVIQKATQICYNRTLEGKDKFPQLMCNAAPYMFLKCIRELNNLHCQSERQFRGAICEQYIEKLKEKYYGQTD